MNCGDVFTMFYTWYRLFAKLYNSICNALIVDKETGVPSATLV